MLVTKLFQFPTDMHEKMYFEECWYANSYSFVSSDKAVETEEWKSMGT